MSAEGATDDRRSGSGWRSRAHRGRLHRRAKRCLPHARRSRLSAGGATRVSRLPPRSGSRPPPSVGFSGALASTGFPRSRPPAGPSLRARRSRRDRPHRHQKTRQVQSDWSPDHRRPRRPEQHPRGRMGNTCIWRSTAIRVRPTRKSCPTRSEAPCLRFLFNALRFFRSLGVKVERVMTTTAQASDPAVTPKPCACSGLGICG